MKRFPVLLLVVAIALTTYAVFALAQGPEGGPPAPPDQQSDDGSMMMGRMMGGTAVAVSGNHIYVVAGGMVLKYDQDLNLVKQAELPVSEAMKRWHEMRMDRMGGGMGPGMGRGRRGGMRGGGGMMDDKGGMTEDRGGMMHGQ